MSTASLTIFVIAIGIVVVLVLGQARRNRYIGRPVV